MSHRNLCLWHVYIKLEHLTTWFPYLTRPKSNALRDVCPLHGCEPSRLLVFAAPHCISSQMLPSIRTIWRRLGSCQSLWFSRSEKGLRICLAAMPVSAAISYTISAVATLTLGSSAHFFPLQVDCGHVMLHYSKPKQFWVLPSPLKWIWKATRVAYHSPFLFQIFLKAQCNCFI